MNTLEYLAEKLRLDLSKQSQIEIQNFGRLELARLFAELGFKKGAEIGTERGLYAEELCKVNPDLELFCIDPWKAYKGYREHTTQAKLDGLFEEAVNRLKPYNCKIIRKFSEEAYKGFPDGSLDFVYIDGNHDAKHVWEDLTNWIPKVKSGGIIAGHDFVRFGGQYGLYNQVKATVLKYAAENNIKHLFILKDPHERPSWMWVK